MPVSSGSPSGERESLLAGEDGAATSEMSTSERAVQGPRSFRRPTARGLAPLAAVAVALAVAVVTFKHPMTKEAAATVSWAFEAIGLDADVDEVGIQSSSSEGPSHDATSNTCVETSETSEDCKMTVDYVFTQALLDIGYAHCKKGDPSAVDKPHDHRRLSDTQTGEFDLSKDKEVKDCVQCALWSKRHEDHSHGCQQPCHPVEGYARCVATKDHGDGGGGDGHHDTGYLALLFLLAMVGMGCLMQVFQDRYLSMVPLTCCLFLAGMLLAVIHHYRPRAPDPHMYSHWYTSVEMWEHVDPHLFFYIFLPLLVFAEAMRLNINLAVRILPQVLLMAVPGVVLGTALTGAFAKYCFHYEWTWASSLLFGSILAATDPVAVVALFNTLGVSPRLTFIISGESLLNDGTAIVAWGLMMLWSTGKNLTWTLCIVYFLKMTIVSVILGVVLAWVAILLIGWCAESSYHTDAMIQVCVTIILCMLCFFLAEAEVSQIGPEVEGERIATSGVLTVVAAGFLVSHFAWPRFVSRETIHVVWEAVEFIGNTVVFFLAGLLWMNKVLENLQHIDIYDLLRLFELYVALHVIRAFIVLVLWPLFNLTGQRVTWKEALVMTTSGLRGAVGLILAIIVDDTPATRDRLGARFLFHIGGIAMMTISINASLAPLLLRSLGLTTGDEIEHNIMQAFQERLRTKAKNAFEEEKFEEHWKGVDRDALEKLLPDLWSEHGHSHKTSEGGEEMGRPKIAADEEPGTATKQEIRTCREAFLRNVRSAIWEDIESGILPKTGRVSRVLLFACEYGLLKTNDSLTDWEMVKYKSKEMMCCLCINRCLGSTWPFKKWDWVQSVFPSESTQGVWKAYLALCFIEAHKSAQKNVPEYLREVVAEETLNMVKDESEKEVEQAQEFLDALDRDAIQHVRERMMAGQILHLQEHEINRYVDHGVLDDKSASQLLHEIHHMKRLLADANYWMSDNITTTTPHE